VTDTIDAERAATRSHAHDQRTMFERRPLALLALLALPLVAAPSCGDSPDAVGQVLTLTSNVSPLLDPAAHSARIVGRIDAAQVPPGAKVHARLARVSSGIADGPGQSAHVHGSSPEFQFEGVPPGDWYVMVDAEFESQSWWYVAPAPGLVEGEARDLGTLTAAPTVIAVHGRLDGTTSTRAEDLVGTAGVPILYFKLLSEGTAPIPFFATVSESKAPFQHLFHGVPAGPLEVWSDVHAPIRPDQRIVQTSGENRVVLGDLPLVVSFVHTIESGPVPRPHVRFHVPATIDREVVTQMEGWAQDLEARDDFSDTLMSFSRGPHVSKLCIDTLAKSSYAYAEVGAGAWQYAAVMRFGGGRPALFHGGLVQIAEGSTAGIDSYPTTTASVRLVLQDGDKASQHMLVWLTPPACESALRTSLYEGAVENVQASGERHLVVSELPVGWTLRLSKNANHEWLIPAEGGVVHPRPRE
jgi:hypothetical protein